MDDSSRARGAERGQQHHHLEAGRRQGTTAEGTEVAPCLEPLLASKVACATPGPPATNSVPSTSSSSPVPAKKWEFLSELAEGTKVWLQELSTDPG